MSKQGRPISQAVALVTLLLTVCSAMAVVAFLWAYAVTLGDLGRHYVSTFHKVFCVITTLVAFLLGYPVGILIWVTLAKSAVGETQAREALFRITRAPVYREISKFCCSVLGLTPVDGHPQAQEDDSQNETSFTARRAPPEKRQLNEGAPDGDADQPSDTSD